jgi:hypothetical protein
MLDITIAVPVIVGLVEVFKRVGLSSRFAPLVSLLLGVGLITLAQGANTDALFLGIIVGLSSCGLYSTGKSMVE